MIVTQQPRKYEWSPMNSTRRVQSYYVRREPASPPDYSDYWGLVTDPDGCARDRRAEREQYLSDIADELAFFRGLLLRAAPWPVSPAVVDVGAGLGWFLSALGPDWRKAAVEIAPQATRALIGQGFATYRDVSPLPGLEFDACFCHHVIEHVDDPVGMLHEIRRCLKPRGWLVIGTPDFGSPCAKRFGENYRLLHDPTHVSLFTNESMHRFLRDHGFTIHDVRYPFPDRYATAETFARWRDTSQVSPPWPGNWLTFYCTKG